MRIISGKCRGRSLRTPKGMQTRPTSDRIRESIFNVLANFGLEETTVLDLFAGTGAMGLEALSRGAVKAVFVDNRTINLVKENIKSCGLSDSTNCFSCDVLSALQNLKANHSVQFDYVFLDPPYDKNYLKPVLLFLNDSDLLADEAILVIESSSREIFWEDEIKLKYLNFKQKKYNSTIITYLQYMSKGVLM